MSASSSSIDRHRHQSIHGEPRSRRGRSVHTIQHMSHHCILCAQHDSYDSLALLVIMVVVVVAIRIVVVVLLVVVSIVIVFVISYWRSRCRCDSHISHRRQSGFRSRRCVWCN